MSCTVDRKSETNTQPHTHISSYVFPTTGPGSGPAVVAVVKPEGPGVAPPPPPSMSMFTARSRLPPHASRRLRASATDAPVTATNCSTFLSMVHVAVNRDGAGEAGAAALALIHVYE